MSNQKIVTPILRLKPIPGLLLDWLPGESLYSLLARNHAVRGHIKPTDTINDFFGMAKDRCLSEGRTELDCLMERTNGSLGSPEEILNEHTVLRFYKPFLRQREKRLLPPGRFGGVDMLKFPLGMHTGRYRRLYPLKGCHACVDEDQAGIGMPYWHLEHQFPGVWICLKHSLPLYRTTAEPAQFDRVHWVTPSLDQFSTLPEHLMHAGSVEKFRWLAEFVTSITNQFYDGADPMEKIRQRFYDYSDQSGLVTGRKKLRGYNRADVTALVSRFERFMPIFSGAEEFCGFHTTTHSAHNLVSRFLNDESWVQPREQLFISAWVELEGIGK